MDCHVGSNPTRSASQTINNSMIIAQLARTVFNTIKDDDELFYKFFEDMIANMSDKELNNLLDLCETEYGFRKEMYNNVR